MLRLLAWLWRSSPPLYVTYEIVADFESPPLFVCSVGVITNFKFPLFNFSFDIIPRQSTGWLGSRTMRAPLGLALVEQPGEALQHVIACHCVHNPVNPDDAEFVREPICNVTECLPLLGLTLRVLS